MTEAAERLARTISTTIPNRDAEGNGESVATDTTSSAELTQVVTEIEVSLVDDSPHQPRRRAISKTDIEELVASIAANGQTAPIIVTPTDAGRYVVHSGHRRCAALRALGREHVKAIVRTDLDDRAARRLAVADNLGRSDLSAYEQAVALDAYRKDYELTLEQAAKELGVSLTTASRLASVTAASDDLQKVVRRQGLSARAAGLLADMERAVPTRRACELGTRLGEGRISLKDLQGIADRARAKVRDKAQSAASRRALRRGVELALNDKLISLRIRIPRDGEPPTDGQKEAVVDAVGRLLAVLDIERVEAVAEQG